MMTHIIAILLLIILNTSTSYITYHPKRITSLNHLSHHDLPPSNHPSNHRRAFLSTMPVLIPVLLTNPLPAKAAYDVSVTNKAISIKPKSSEEARKRFQEARTSINYLLQNYDTICEGGGDNIRRYLGTVGTSSPLYGIKSVFKYLQE